MHLFKIEIRFALLENASGLCKAFPGLVYSVFQLVQYAHVKIGLAHNTQRHELSGNLDGTLEMPNGLPLGSRHMAYQESNIFNHVRHG